MSKLKKFFSPVEGGHWNEYSFKDHISQLENGGLIVVFLVASVVLGCNKDMFAGEEHWYWILLVGGISILGIIIYNVLKHWKRLKSSARW